MRVVSISSSTGADSIADSITVAERPVPVPRAGEVRIAVAAAAVNPADLFLWHNVGGSLQPPVVPGLDAAGTVDALGPDVDRLAVGDRVMAVVNPRRPEGGAQSEFVVVPAASVVRVPEEVDLVAAATLPMTGLTALQGLHLLDLAPGASLALTGGAGLLASYTIPLAKQRGLHVIADAAPADRELVLGFGVDDVIPRGDEFGRAVRGLLPDGVDAVYDTAAVTRAALPAIRDGGSIAVVRGWDDAGPAERSIDVRPVSVGAALLNTDWLQQLADHAAAGHLRLRVVDTYPPEAAFAAYTRMQAGGVRGRLVITFHESF